MGVLRRAGLRVRGFLRTHKHAEEVAAEAVGINIAARLIGSVLCASAASAAITVVATQTSSYHPSYSLSAKGAAFIARNEGLRLSPYNDPFNCTWGIGDLRHYGRCSSAELGLRLTTAQAMALLAHDAASAGNCVRQAVTHPIGQPAFDSLVDLTFNIGCGGLQRSSALRELNAGRLVNVPARLLVWSYANGRYLPGLHARRVAEGLLFTRGFYGAGIGYYTQPKPPKPVNLRTVPSPVPSWAWRWAAWELGRKPYRGHAGQPAYRPRVAPKRVPAWSWSFLGRFTRTVR